MLLALPLCLPAQDRAVQAVVPPAKVTVARGSTVEVRLKVQLRPGYHVNSHAPTEDYLVPLRLSWESKPFQILDVVYPKPEFQSYEFAEKPLSVLSGAFEIMTRLKAPADAPRGPGILLGKLRYQACTDKLCLPPRTLEVRLPYEIR